MRCVLCTSPPRSACPFQGPPLESNTQAIHGKTTSLRRRSFALVRILDNHNMLTLVSTFCIRRSASIQPPYANDMLRVALRRRQTHPRRVPPHKPSFCYILCTNYLLSVRYKRTTPKTLTTNSGITPTCQNCLENATAPVEALQTTHAVQRSCIQRHERVIGTGR